MPKTRRRTLADAAKEIQARKVNQKQATKDKTPAVRPTDERQAQNQIKSAGMASFVIPVINTLLERKQITPEEHAALSKYRQAALLAKSSLTRSCLNDNFGGSGNGPSAAVTSAKIDAALYENRAGVHAELMKAVCFDDQSLTQWCIERFGGRERVKGGRVVEIRPVGNGHVKRALRDLRKAARKIDP